MNDATQMLHNTLCDIVSVPYGTSIIDIRVAIHETGKNAILASSMDSQLFEALCHVENNQPLNAILACACACGYGGVGPVLAWRDLQMNCEDAIIAKFRVDKLVKRATVSA